MGNQNWPFPKFEQNSYNFSNLKQSILIDNNPDNNYQKLEILVFPELTADVDSDDLENF
jgi:hypothetical protein